MPVTLPDLPYPVNALEPHMSARTLTLHHDKHHKTYVETLNKLLAGTPFANASLDEIMIASVRNESMTKIFNNAAQCWNHTFFWQSMAPMGGGKPDNRMAQAIEKDFGSYERFRDRFIEAAAAQFGSGWAWLILNGDGTLEITTTSNAVNPPVNGDYALLTCDVWEHAYYLDYQNRRAEFVGMFLDKLANWNFAAERLARAAGERDVHAAPKRRAHG